MIRDDENKLRYEHRALQVKLVEKYNCRIFGLETVETKSMYG
jgi:hypothetical protein